MILMYSDMHLRPERIRDCETALDAVFNEAVAIRAKTKKDVVIYNGGDTFNVRGLIRTSCIDVLNRHYTKWANEGLHQIINVGNHDQEDRDGEIHPMRVFHDWKKDVFWKVVDSPMYLELKGTLKRSLFCPYMKLDRIAELVETTHDADLDLYVHWGFLGAQMNDFKKDTTGVPIDWVKKFRNVFSGHYHLRSKIENVHYIGSPFQQNFNEMNQEKGMLIYEKNKISFKEISGTSKHHEAKIGFKKEKPQVESHNEIKESDFIRLKVEGDSEQQLQVNQDWAHKQFKCSNIKIEREVRDKSFSRLSISQKDVLSPTLIATKYVEFMDSGLDKKKLMTIGSDIMDGSL